MSLFRDSMRPPPIASDATLRRYLDLVRAEIEPDPLFRRRLRGTILNQFVAVREGVAPTMRFPSRAMGRLGRACLYASVAVAMSVGVTMAASQSALPGDPLYAVKLRIEQLRVVALPAEFQDDLAVYALTERINELNLLAEAGEIERAEALVSVIEDQVAIVAALGIAPEAQNSLIASRLDVLETLVDRLPLKAQLAIERAMAGAPGLVKAGPGPAAGSGEGPGGGGGQVGVPAVAEPAATSKPSDGGDRQPQDQASTSTRMPSPTASPRQSPPPKEKVRGGGQDADADSSG